MERSISVLQQRATSFNPEAAAFNPEISSPIATPTADDLHSTFLMAPMFNYSPFHGPGNLPALYSREPVTRAPVRLEDFLSPDVQALVKKLEEHPDVQELRALHTPAPDLVQTRETVVEPVSSLRPFTYPQEQLQPACKTLDIEELSTGLGLPVAKAEINEDIPPSASYRSPVSQAHPGALYGKLIGWALDKPLTAKGLADFLQNQERDARTKAPAAAPPSSSTGAESDQDFRCSPMRSGLRSNLEFSTSPRDHIVAPIHTDTSSTPKGPSTPQHQHRRSSVSSCSYRHHSRVPSKKRYPPRRTSRTKRIDQGPLPSAADIYPDDAHWTPAAPIHKVHNHLSYHQEHFEQSEVVVGNPFNWPLPSQVYKPEPAPTVADMNAADIDVLALLSELPEPSLDTLAKLGNSHDLRISSAFDLHCDKRVLTPTQRDGSRYGMRFHGLAYGDQWELPRLGDFEESETFRVGSRNHDVWSGRGGALSKGW